jgi:hypothetical protein
MIKFMHRLKWFIGELNQETDVLSKEGQHIHEGQHIWEEVKDGVFNSLLVPLGACLV